ncbi:uncharacterized protein LOC103985271 isoform X2 [Musa acuminata AAA Group]|uniref:uncharacterized protein LOC103985271 isoform X2 n=1 Tax=Musa acuminata AAA Group TaxID=214697 RepID=UPI0031D048CF
MGKSVEEAMLREIEGTPSPSEAKRRRRCVQSKLCWGRPRGDGGEAAATDVVEAGESEREDTEGENTGKRERKRKPKAKTPKKSPITRRTPRTGNKSSLVSPGNKSGKSLKNCQSSDASKSDATKDLDGPFSPKCNLHLEAKLAAEENMHLSAGKQMHPLFTSRKEVKMLQEVQDTKKLEDRQLPWYTWGEVISYAPVHILGTQVDDVSLDWGNWNFMGQTLDYGGRALEDSLVVCGGLVKPLRLDTSFLEEMHMNQTSNTEEKSSTITTFVVSDGQYEKQQLLPYLEYHLNSNFPLLSRCGSYVENSESRHQDELHKERLLSYYRRSEYCPECSLWTAKYQPENASEVCGNFQSVRQLSEWLKSWHDKGQKSGKKCSSREHYTVEDDEIFSETEFDMDDREDDFKLSNVLLITGPVGANASELRNGANIKRKFQEAMGSHRYNRWSFDDTIGSSKQNLDVVPGMPNTRDNVKFESFTLKAPTDMQENFHTECSRNKENRIAIKTLILFEDVDTVFEEDCGFISSVLQLAETAKRPIILTSNSKNPVLPPLLNRLVLNFELPSAAELFWHLYMICASEKAQISAHLLEQLIISCLGDIRKIIMLLQFWCQGNKYHVVRNLHTCSPLQFDIDTVHLVIPRIIPWGFQCELSEKVADEISRSMFSMEDNIKLMEFKPAEKVGSAKVEKIHNVINKRKKSKLKRKQSDLDSTEFPADAKDLDDFSDASESYARFDQQQITRQRAHIVLSSQSDDEPSAVELQPAEIVSADLSYCPLPDMSNLCSLQTLKVVSPLRPLADLEYQSQRNCIQPLLESSDIASVSHICDTFKVQEVSCVPESSFVAESDISRRDNAISMAVSSNTIAVNLIDLLNPIHDSPEVNNLTASITEVNLCPVSNINEVDAESVYGNEELGDSQNGVQFPANGDGIELPASGYQFMDECSRADFSIGLVPGRCERSPRVFSVQETWQRLRNQREELRTYLSKNQMEYSVVDLASGLTDLISETDIMFSRSNLLINDILEPSLIPSEPDDFSWYDRQYEMGSTYVQHGLCLYTDKCAKTCPDMVFMEPETLVLEMLASSTNAMAMGKLLSLESTNTQNLSNHGLNLKEIGHGISLERKQQCALMDALLPLVPARLSMTLRGSGFHDYLSFTSRISRFESARISESMKENSHRRSRDLRHYLSSGSLLLSREDVALLARACCFKEAVP